MQIQDSNEIAESNQKYRVLHARAVLIIIVVAWIVALSLSIQASPLSPNLPESSSSKAIKANIKTMLMEKKEIAPLADIPIVATAADATLTDAAYYAWQEFIALNWPAKAQTGNTHDRETPDSSKKFGDIASKSSIAYPALVWETFRHKVEIYPGQGSPHGYLPSGKLSVNTKPANASQDFGYDDLPRYIYNSDKTNIIPFVSLRTPWLNLDEASQIGTNQIYSGLDLGQVAPEGPGRLLLFLAKANRKQYQYVASRGWWNKDIDNPFSPADTIKRTADYVTTQKKTPASSGLIGSLKTVMQQKKDADTVSFADGTMEVKTAWRLATAAEKLFYKTNNYIEGYHAAQVRYYLGKQDSSGSSTGKKTYVEQDDLGVMLGLHIIHKTPKAPYFIFASFEHKDNIRRADGTPLEDADGSIIGSSPNSITSSTVTSVASQAKAVVTASGNKQTLLTLQTFTPNEATASDYETNNQSYFINSHATNLASDKSGQPKIGIDKRRFGIPANVIKVNKDVHQMISAANSNAANPWGNYRLTNVQWKPLTKAPGTVYSSLDSAEQSTYYTSNSVIETNHILSEFSGRFSGVGNTITDFSATKTGETGTTNIAGIVYQNGSVTGDAFNNVYANGKGHLMGGCMGCHGNQQVSGSDFSFIFAEPVSNPDSAERTYPYPLIK